MMILYWKLADSFAIRGEAGRRVGKRERYQHGTPGRDALWGGGAFLYINEDSSTENEDSSIENMMILGRPGREPRYYIMFIQLN